MRKIGIMESWNDERMGSGIKREEVALVSFSPIIPTFHHSKR
jgi:hypothetical protein